MPGAHVFESVDSIQVLGAWEHSHSLVRIGICALEVSRVEVVEHRIARGQVDAAHQIDQLDEPLEAYPGPLVDVDVEVALDGRHGRGVAVLVDLVDLAVTAGGPRHVEVAGDRQNRHVPRGGVDPYQDHRLCQV